MQISRPSGVRAGLLSVLALAAVPAGALAAPVTSNLRIEGVERTYFEGPVTTDVRQLDGRDGTGPHACDGTSAGAAAPSPTVGGLFGTAAERAPFGYRAQFFPSFGDFFVQTVEGETPNQDADDPFFGVFVNGSATLGICSTTVSGGEDVLIAVTDGDDQVLALSAADTAKPGDAVELTVTDRASGQSVPGALVGGQTTDANGKARVTATQRGATSYKATKPGTIRSNAEPVCVTDGQDGFCGTRRPDGTAGPGSGAPTTTAARDTTRPVGRVSGLRSGRTFTRAKAPRELKVTASDSSGIAQVKLRLTRRNKGRCAYLSGRKDRFVSTRCGRSFAFKASDRESFSYLLPERLAPGRYVLDVVAIDRAFNRDELARGRNRIVFTVR